MENLTVYLFQILFIISSTFTKIYSSPYAPYEPIVSIQDGYIRGSILESRIGRQFEAYRRIPFAKAPVGSLRFKGPQPIEPWDGILDATRDGPVCLQKNYLFANPKVEGHEDCLYLNVYVPKIINAEEPLPVMAAIHWGGFFAGRSTSDYYGPELLMDKDVILVTFNYRLGILGFLSTLDDEAPGNNALKDQVAALRWIQRNIRCFNGDPNRVTIFGNSAGAGSTHLHLLSPLSDGLFHQVITQSGSALALWATPLNDLHKQIVNVQAQISGCDSSNSKILIDCLQKIDATDLVNSGDAFKFFSVDPLIVYTLVTENKTERNPEPFLTKLPVEYIQAGEFKNLPWIIGTVKNEGGLRASRLTKNSEERDSLNKNFTNIMMKEMYYDISVGTDEKTKLDIHKKVQNFYMKGQEYLNPDDLENVLGFHNLWSDRSMKYPFYQSVMLHSAMGHKPIWAYSFEYEGQNSYEKLWSAMNDNATAKWGTVHCDDLLYLYSSPALFPDLTDYTDLGMSEIMLDRWTNFAIYGTPQSSSNENIWPSLQFSGLDNMKNENLYLLNITGSYDKNFIQEIIEKGYLKDRMLFWASQPLFENFEGLQ